MCGRGGQCDNNCFLKNYCKSYCSRVLCSAVLYFLFWFVFCFGGCDGGVLSNDGITKRDVLDENLASYLTQFGYLEQSADGAFALRTAESFRVAIKDMQQFAGIPVTGELDNRTKELMRTPRCGLPDRDIRITSGRRKRYAIHGPKWPYTNLTWSLRSRNLPSLDTYEVRFVISKALEVWSRHSQLTFTEVDRDNADILIYFYSRDHGDNFPFDGKGVILAHAFFPTGMKTSVDVHFDADENWSTSEQGVEGTNLFNVAAHEIGHSLGLSHSNEEGALMYPWYKEMNDGFNYELPEDDKLAIQYLYGVRDRQWERIPEYNPRPTRPTTTTTTTTTTTRPPHRTYNTRPHRPYDPRYPQGQYPPHQNPYSPQRPEKNPYKPMHPDKKPHYPKYDYPYGNDRNRYHHHKHNNDPYNPGRNYPPPGRNPEKYPPTSAPTRRPTTTNPPKETPVGKSPPDTCDTSYDAVAVIRREVFIFKDRYFWRIGDTGLMPGTYPAEITRLWRGFPRNLTHVDAVYERPDGNIVFFVDDQYYVFSGVVAQHGYPRPLTELGLPPTLRKIDGAMVWGHNGKTYFFSGDMYWRFDEDVQKVELDYPRNMAMFKGVGTDIDAVFQWKDGKTYFFKGKGFWKFNDLHMRVEHADQKLSAPFWMGCSKNYEENDLVNEKLPYRTEVVAENSAFSKNTRGCNSVVISIVIFGYFLVVSVMNKSWVQ